MSPKYQKRTFLNASPFAESDEEANDRYLTHKSVDPFPEIPSALLNSADLYDYVNKTGLIFPFDDDDENLKAAAYRVRILGEIVYWEAGGLLKSCVLGEDDQFVLAPNSITYITLEPVFRIPDYIKVWFNLDASHVYKGLFLNSGFIDPGFVGRLVLPLHNPTANEYLLKARDSLIWISLMKISPWPQWEQPALFNTTVRTGKFRKFPDHKKNPTIEDRLQEALGSNDSIQNASAVILANIPASSTPRAVAGEFNGNSIPKAPVESHKAHKTDDRWKFGLFIAIATLVFTIIAAMGGMLGVGIGMLGLEIQTNLYQRKLAEDLLVLQQRQGAQDRAPNPPAVAEGPRGDPQNDRKPVPRRVRHRHGSRRKQNIMVDSSTGTKNTVGSK